MEYIPSTCSFTPGTVLLSPTSLHECGANGEHDSPTTSRELQGPWLPLCLTEDGQQPDWYDCFHFCLYLDSCAYCDTLCLIVNCRFSSLTALTSYATSISGSPVYLHGHTPVGTPSFSRQHFSPHPWSASTQGIFFLTLLSLFF